MPNPHNTAVSPPPSAYLACRDVPSLTASLPAPFPFLHPHSTINTDCISPNPPWPHDVPLTQPLGIRMEQMFQGAHKSQKLNPTHPAFYSRTPCRRTGASEINTTTHRNLPVDPLRIISHRHSYVCVCIGNIHACFLFLGQNHYNFPSICPLPHRSCFLPPMAAPRPSPPVTPHPIPTRFSN